MKFSQSLQFNAVPEWREFYIDYDGLKKLIYQLERASLAQPDVHASSLVGKDPEAVFRGAIDEEIAKVEEFFAHKQPAIYGSYDALVRGVARYDSTVASSANSIYRDDEERVGHAHSNALEGNEEDAASGSSEDELPTPRVSNSSEPSARRRRSSIHREGSLAARNQPLTFQRVTLASEIVTVYVSMSELLSYTDLNRTGLRKALKKFDKTLGRDILPEYKAGPLKQAHAFSNDTSCDIGDRIDHLVELYAELEFDGKRDMAETTLKRYLREHVVYERNTVWRDLVALDTQAQAEPKLSKDIIISFCGKPLHLPGRLVSRNAATLWFIAAVFLMCLAFPMLPSHPTQSRCFAIVAAASLLWATEALPLFVTSLMVPMAVVVLRIPLDESGEPMTAVEASNFVFAKMWSPVITVLLGGFTLAAALSKYNIAKAMATTVISKSGSDSPRIICLLLMSVAAFLCMWISNVAAPVLMFSVAQPLLRTLPTEDPFGKALVLGIALASNIGGMTSPIASPQNILALQNMDPEPSWVEWFAVALPISAISILFIWIFLMATFPPSAQARSNVAHLRATGHVSSAEFGRKHWFIIFITFLTIGVWCVSHQLEGVAGDMGVLALFPIVVLFGTGILTAADFNNFMWTIVALAMGGIVLGKSVESCGLLATAAASIQRNVAGLSLFSVCIIFGAMILVVASFISHTVAALIVLPLVKSIGEQMDVPHPRLLVMLSAFLCSAAMALPTSGLPNVTAICLTDELGKPYLSVGDFLTRGIPASLIAYVVVVTLGYGIALLLGF